MNIEFFPLTNLASGHFIQQVIVYQNVAITDICFLSIVGVVFIGLKKSSIQQTMNFFVDRLSITE